MLVLNHGLSGLEFLSPLLEFRDVAQVTQVISIIPLIRLRIEIETTVIKVGDCPPLLLIFIVEVPSHDALSATTASRDLREPELVVVGVTTRSGPTRASCRTAPPRCCWATPASGRRVPGSTRIGQLPSCAPRASWASRSASPTPCSCRSPRRNLRRLDGVESDAMIF